MVMMMMERNAVEVGKVRRRKLFLHLHPDRTDQLVLVPGPHHALQR